MKFAIEILSAVPRAECSTSMLACLPLSPIEAGVTSLLAWFWFFLPLLAFRPFRFLVNLSEDIDLEFHKRGMTSGIAGT